MTLRSLGADIGRILELFFVTNRASLRQTLVGLGYRVLAVADRQQVLRLCKSETPALAILDVIMPRMGGPATAVALLAQVSNLEPPLP